jgi:mRNA-degrading endonuclease RelE of RelBE toxin-antitoxin system
MWDFGAIRRLVERFLFEDSAEPFPWVADLSPADRAAFRAELEGLWQAASASGRWGEVREFLEDWEATAEVTRDRNRTEFLKRPPEEKEYWEDQLVPLSAVPVAGLGAVRRLRGELSGILRADVGGYRLYFRVDEDAGYINIELVLRRGLPR